ncbi:hypothetical protein ACVR05_05775 [Streptococcus caprae]|uniref:Uncharacterized protein n=1 Tax=Streptococcus caprae TaxID=1640501 RepID=A0ABV8CWK8_9STRE
MSKTESKIAEKMSQNPKAQLVLSLIFGFFILVGAWWGRQELLAWEATGGEKALPRFVYWLYSIGGVNAPAILLGLGSLIFFGRAYQIVKEMKNRN